MAAVKEFGEDRIPAAAASVTFYMLLAIFPAPLGAFVSLYGLFGDVGTARRQVLALAGLLPGGALSVLSEELNRLSAANHGTLGLAFAISLAVSIWGSNAGAKAMIDGLNVAYEARRAARLHSGHAGLSGIHKIGVLALLIAAWPRSPSMRRG